MNIDEKKIAMWVDQFSYDEKTQKGEDLAWTQKVKNFCNTYGSANLLSFFKVRRFMSENKDSELHDELREIIVPRSFYDRPALISIEEFVSAIWPSKDLKVKKAATWAYTRYLEMGAIQYDIVEIYRTQIMCDDAFGVRIGKQQLILPDLDEDTLSKLETLHAGFFYIYDKW